MYSRNLLAPTALFATLLWLGGCVTEPLPEPDTDPACRDARSPEFVACQFYGRYITLQPAGVPGETALDILSPFITESLDGALFDTHMAQDAWLADHPGETAPLSEGALFTGPALHPERFVILRRVPISRTHVGVEVGLEQGNIRWRDTAVLALTRQGFLLDDIRFEDGSTLRHRLP